MKKHLWSLALPTLALICALAAGSISAGGMSAECSDSFRGEADATGTAVLWFGVQDVTADVTADVSLRAVLSVAGMQIPFTATGRASGTGKANMQTLAVDAWIIVDGQGKTESGAAVTVRGGISITALDAASTTSTSGRGSGRFYLLIATTTGTWTVEGDATGGAAGTFVVPDNPQTMQMDAAGTFMLTGEPRPWHPANGSALPDWPEALLAEMSRQAGASGNDAGE